MSRNAAHRNTFVASDRVPFGRVGGSPTTNEGILQFQPQGIGCGDRAPGESEALTPYREAIMRKMRLDLDALTVESFEVQGAAGRGTVRAHESDTEGALCGGTLYCANDTFDPCQGGNSAATACGPCPGTANTNCGQQTCARTCHASCLGPPASCGGETCVHTCEPWCTF